MFNKHPVMSLLDSDAYKFSMMQFVLHQFPSTTAKFKFKCRNKDVELGDLFHEIREELMFVQSLKFTYDELDYLRSLRFLTDDYVDFLEDFRLKGRYVNIDVEANQLLIEIEGPWLQTILWEIPILKIVHEVYSKNKHKDIDLSYARGVLDTKAKFINENNLTVVDFGSRRAFSSRWHDAVVNSLALEGAIKGTSNVILAKKYNLTPIGTMAHEVFQACQGMDVKARESQKLALDTWSREFRGDLGIALTDTLGIDKFLIDFDPYFAKLFDGVRHDSGDPLVWADKMIAHYEKFNINPKSKSLVFSDGLDVAKALEIKEHVKGRAKTSFGIGTNLTNDVGFPFLQIVIKMIECNGHPVAKISDDPVKTMCEDDKYINHLKDIIKDDYSKRKQ